MTDAKIHILDKDMVSRLTVPLDDKFGSLRFQFEENGEVTEVPIFPKMLHDFLIKDLYQYKESINS